MHAYELVKSNPLPRGGSSLGGSQMKSPEEEDLVGFLFEWFPNEGPGGRGPSSSSGLFIDGPFPPDPSFGNHPKWKPPRGLGVLSIRLHQGSMPPPPA